MNKSSYNNGPFGLNNLINVTHRLVHKFSDINDELSNRITSNENAIGINEAGIVDGRDELDIVRNDVTGIMEIVDAVRDETNMNQMVNEAGIMDGRDELDIVRNDVTGIMEIVDAVRDETNMNQMVNEAGIMDGRDELDIVRNDVTGIMEIVDAVRDETNMNQMVNEAGIMDGRDELDIVRNDVTGIMEIVDAVRDETNMNQMVNEAGIMDGRDELDIVRNDVTGIMEIVDAVRDETNMNQMVNEAGIMDGRDELDVVRNDVTGIMEIVDAVRDETNMNQMVNEAGIMDGRDELDIVRNDVTGIMEIVDAVRDETNMNQMVNEAGIMDGRDDLNVILPVIKNIIDSNITYLTVKAVGGIEDDDEKFYLVITNGTNHCKTNVFNRSNITLNSILQNNEEIISNLNNFGRVDAPLFEQFNITNPNNNEILIYKEDVEGQGKWKNMLPGFTVTDEKVIFSEDVEFTNGINVTGGTAQFSNTDFEFTNRVEFKKGFEVTGGDAPVFKSGFTFEGGETTFNNTCVTFDPECTLIINTKLNVSDGILGELRPSFEALGGARPKGISQDSFYNKTANNERPEGVPYNLAGVQPVGYVPYNNLPRDYKYNPVSVHDPGIGPRDISTGVPITGPWVLPGYQGGKSLLTKILQTQTDYLQDGLVIGVAGQDADDVFDLVDPVGRLAKDFSHFFPHSQIDGYYAKPGDTGDSVLNGFNGEPKNGPFRPVWKGGDSDTRGLRLAKKIQFNDINNSVTALTDIGSDTQTLPGANYIYVDSGGCGKGGYFSTSDSLNGPISATPDDFGQWNKPTPPENLWISNITALNLNLDYLSVKLTNDKRLPQSNYNGNTTLSVINAPAVVSAITEYGINTSTTYAPVLPNFNNSFNTSSTTNPFIQNFGNVFSDYQKNGKAFGVVQQDAGVGGSGELGSEKGSARIRQSSLPFFRYFDYKSQYYYAKISKQKYYEFLQDCRRPHGSTGQIANDRRDGTIDNGGILDPTSDTTSDNYSTTKSWKIEVLIKIKELYQTNIILENRLVDMTAQINNLTRYIVEVLAPNQNAIFTKIKLDE